MAALGVDGGDATASPVFLRTSRNATSTADLFWGTTTIKGFLCLQVLTNTVARKTSARKEKLLGLMTRVNGRGRLIPTPALSKIMLHLAAGALGGPSVNRTLYCIAPATVTVTVTECPGQASLGASSETGLRA